MSDFSSERLKENSTTAALESAKEGAGDSFEKKKEVFYKHRAMKINEYTNFNNKEDSYHDVGEFSWDF
jgi:hypothetical protein